MTATTKSPLVTNPTDELLRDDELDEGLGDDELDEGLREDELDEGLGKDELVLAELLLIEELVELLLEFELPPPLQPTNQMLVAASASEKNRLFAVLQFMNVNHSVIDGLSVIFYRFAPGRTSAHLPRYIFS